MIRRLPVLALATLLAACNVPMPPPPDTARMLQSPFVLGDPDVWALNQAQWAFAVPSRTANRPADAARAVAAIDYLGGQINTSPRWVGMDALVRVEMLQARVDVRAALGIAPNAPSQLVVDTMMAAADALMVGDPVHALAAFNNPAYTRGPEQTLATLTNMPYVQSANLATMRMAADMVGNGGRGNIRW